MNKQLDEFLKTYVCGCSDVECSYRMEARQALLEYMEREKIEELKAISTDGYDDFHGTYDFDRIAEGLLRRISELEAQRSKLDGGKE